jgi:hypothetical protein
MGGGSNSDNSTTTQEAIKWTKVVQLGRLQIADHNTFALTTYNNGWAIGAKMNIYRLSPNE